MLAMFRFLRRWLRVELCVVGVQRFGHLSLEPEVLLCLDQIQREKSPSRTLRLWSFGRPRVQSNQALVRMWRREVKHAPGRFVGALIRGGTLVPDLALPRTPLSVHGPANVLDRFESRLRRVASEGGRTVLSRLGLNPETRYACLAIRDGAYYQQSGTKESSGYSLLNFEASQFVPAIEMLIDHGYFVIRMGTPTENVLPEMTGLLDYANSPLRSEPDDIEIIRNCAFVLSTQTGIDALALALRKPVLYIDTLRLSQFFLGTRLATWNPVKFIPRGSNLPLSLEPLFESRFMWMEDPDEFLTSGARFVRSSGEDVAKMVENYLQDLRGETPAELKNLRISLNERMTRILGNRGQQVWGNVTASLNGWWLRENSEWFLSAK